MKNILIALILIIFCIGCNMSKRQDVHLDEKKMSKYLDFIVDSTLERAYIDDSLFFTTRRMPAGWSGEVVTAKSAFAIAEQIMNSTWNKEDIEAQKPFSINLIDNKIWVIEGTLHQPDDGSILFGWVVYIEINKENGEILRIVQTE